MDLKDTMLSKKASLRRLPSAWFCLHYDLEMTKLETGNRLVVVREGKEAGGWAIMGKARGLVVMAWFPVVTLMVGA